MKNKLIAFFLLFLVSMGVQTHAQNANRRGFFVEVQGGAALGDVISFNEPWLGYDGVYLKGGVTGSVDVGYRLRLSNPWAFDVKLGLWSDFADFEKTWNLRLMPGLRWTSNDFSGNKSIYLAFNAGFGIGSDADYMCIPLELSAGINLTPKIYLGLSWIYNPRVVNDLWSEEGGKYIMLNVHNYNSLALRLGYRF